MNNTIALVNQTILKTEDSEKLCLGARGFEPHLSREDNKSEPLLTNSCTCFFGVLGLSRRTPFHTGTSGNLSQCGSTDSTKPSSSEEGSWHGNIQHLASGPAILEKQLYSYGVWLGVVRYCPVRHSVARFGEDKNYTFYTSVARHGRVGRRGAWPGGAVFGGAGLGLARHGMVVPFSLKAELYTCSESGRQSWKHRLANQEGESLESESTSLGSKSLHERNTPPLFEGMVNAPLGFVAVGSGSSEGTERTLVFLDYLIDLNCSVCSLALLEYLEQPFFGWMTPWVALPLRGPEVVA